MMSDEEFYARLPPGYKFQPNDQLILSYLASKVENEPLSRTTIHEADFYGFSPDLLAGFENAFGVDEWYFFTRTDDGSWVEKVVRNGVWKVAGCDEVIEHDGQEIGYKKSAAFFMGKNVAETDWLMTEFRLKKAVQTDDWVICKLYTKMED